MKRRVFLKRFAQVSVLAATSGWCAGSVSGANDRVRLGVIGCGGRGRFVSRHLAEAGAQVVALCDVYETQMRAANQEFGGSCRCFGDFRHVLDQHDVDAVLVATPDHWHAIPTVMACQAGKDVYVEKPLGHNVHEGRAMLRAAEQSGRIVQAGTQQRSAPHFQEARQIIQSGELGKVHFVRVWNYMNFSSRSMYPRKTGPKPVDVDWDFYLGPAPEVPFDWDRFVGNYRWFFDYAGGLITDYGTHRIDMVHQIMGEGTPLTIAAAGQRFESSLRGDVPDVLQVTYTYPGFALSYEACALNAHGLGGRSPGRSYYLAQGADDRPHGIAFYGTKGALFADRIGFEIYPELAPDMDGASGAGKPPSPIRKERAARDATDLHARNFIDCIRSRRKPAAEIQQCHLASSACHLGNIAYKTGRKLSWDAAQETIKDDPGAASLLGRQPRKPWDLIKD
jgi:predicted dehydrogenase